MMSGSKVPNNDTYGLFVLRTLTILQNIRISRDCCPTFMLIFWRLKRFLPTHEQAQVCKDLLPLVSYILRKFLFTIIYSIQSSHVCVNKMNRTGIILRTKMKGANPRIYPLTEWFYAWRNDIGAKSVLFCCIRIYSEPLSQNRCYAASLLLMWL